MLGESFDDLLEAARAGDEDAFAAIWREHNPGLLRYLRVVDRDIADDVAADTWLDVARGLTRFRGDENGFRSWLFTIARRRRLDVRRAAGRRPRSTATEDALADVPDEASPALTVDERLSTDAALRLISTLPPDQAEVVALRVIADLDVRQVARLVGKRPGTVRVLAHRGLRRLEEILGDQDEL
jgi:RNA polymerase sigma-70 factor (ECF subfamily)